MTAQNSFVYKHQILCYQNPGYLELQSLIHDNGYSNPDSYSSSALYHFLTGRKGLWLYKTSESCLITSIHPHSENCLLVFPEISRDTDYSLTSLVLNGQGSSWEKVQLARYTEDELNRLKYQLDSGHFKKSIGIEVIEETSMDWRYPVRILDTNMVSLIDGAHFVKIRNKVRRVSNKITIHAISEPSNLEMIEKILRVWEGNMIAAKKSTEDMLSLYFSLVKLIENNYSSIDGLFFLLNQVPVGFTVWDELHPNIANLFANLCDTSIAGLSDFQLVNSCKKLAEKGINLINMGGSEIESLDTFKKKYCPVKTIPIFSANIQRKNVVSSSSEMLFHKVYCIA